MDSDARIQAFNGKQQHQNLVVVTGMTVLPVQAVCFVPGADIKERNLCLNAAEFLQSNITLINIFFFNPAQSYVKFCRTTVFVGFKPDCLVMFE